MKVKICILNSSQNGALFLLKSTFMKDILIEKWLTTYIKNIIKYLMKIIKYGRVSIKKEHYHYMYTYNYIYINK